MGLSMRIFVPGTFFRAVFIYFEAHGSSERRKMDIGSTAVSSLPQPCALDTLDIRM